MKQWWLLPALVGLAGCTFAKADEHDPRAECQVQANSDPTVQDLRLKQFSLTPSDPNINPDITVAIHNAVQRCLQDKGLAPPGGVDPIRPRL
jgi:hypothetical protein